MSRTSVLAALAVLVLVAGVATWWLTRAPLPATGPLHAALVADPRSAEADETVTDLFAPFLDGIDALEERAAVLEANGFACTIEAGMVEGNRLITCDRDAGSDFFCKRFWRYYAYRTADGTYLDAIGVKRSSCWP